MPATCSICASPARAEIERRLVSGQSMRTIAGQLDVSRSAIGRHRDSGHIAVAVNNVRAIEVGQHELDLSERAQDLYRRAEVVLQRVEGQAILELAAIRELRAVVELLAKLTAPPSPMRDDGPLTVHVRFASSLPTPPLEVAALPSTDEG